MSLLPLNESKELHTLDEIVASRFETLFASNLSTAPLTTDSKNLSVLSFIYDIDIVGLSEGEAREILNLFYEIRKYSGTVYVMKKVLSVFFADVKIDDSVGGFLFDLSLELENDVSVEKLEKIKILVDKYKNVRSHLRYIILNLPSMEGEFLIGQACVFGVDFDMSVQMSDIEIDIKYNPNTTFRVGFDI